MGDLSVALVHYPVVDRNGQLITASVTNWDLQDIARSCRTFGVKKYFVVHPSPDEQALNQRILGHWMAGYGMRAHPTRTDAMGLVELVANFNEVLEMVGPSVYKVGTSAKAKGPRVITLSDFQGSLDKRDTLLVFGTGYGLAPDFCETLDAFLPPIEGPSDYNHLSVRSAVAIYLDRIRGKRS